MWHRNLEDQISEHNKGKDLNFGLIKLINDFQCILGNTCKLAENDKDTLLVFCFFVFQFSCYEEKKENLKISKPFFL